MNTKNYGKEEIGPSNKHEFHPTKIGFSVWIENGVYFQAPTVDASKYGNHAYDGGGYERGVRSCSCGCYMHSTSSGGPCDPFGPCPENPQKL